MGLTTETHNSTTAVLLLAHGSPRTPSEVPEYLRYVTSGRALPQTVIDEITHRYALVGSSPLTHWTLKQSYQLADELHLPVYVGMRNWQPFISDVVRSMVNDGIVRAVVICMAPHNSRTSVGLYRRALGEQAGAPFVVEFIDSWHDHPLLVQAFAEKFQWGWQKVCAEAGARVPVIFTAHSVPERTITEGDLYKDQAYKTAELVAQAAGLPGEAWNFAFQSQGMSGGPWIGPTVEDTILCLKQKGHDTVFIQPVGFLCDHVEILYDIDIAFKEFAEKNGMHLWRAESLNDSPLLTSALADLARSRLRAATGSTA